MEFFLVYGLWLLLTALCGGFWITYKIKRDLEWEDCVTIGTVIFILFTLVCAFVPGLNIIYALIAGICLLFHFEDEVKDFFDMPLCDLPLIDRFFRKGAK